MSIHELNMSDKYDIFRPHEKKLITILWTLFIHLFNDNTTLDIYNKTFWPQARSMS